MKLLILFLMIFSISGLHAQLTVSPSSYADSYIYAKDRILYVKNEVNLSENKKNETEANIYLRKEAQLIQGDKSANQNKGTGKISIFQQGTSNAFDYNYWGLPVTVSSEKSQLNDYIYDPQTKTESRQAKLVSAINGSSDPLSISRQWIYTLSGNDYSSWHYLGDHFDLAPGEGFTMKGVDGTNLLEIENEVINKGSSQTYDFRGLPNDGIIEMPIVKDQILLIGNPYPSAINLDKFLTENISSTGIAYFWDSKKNGDSHFLADYEGGYGAYSPGAEMYVPPVFKKYSDYSETGETGNMYGRKIAPIAQGFIIIGKSSGMISFRNTQRIFQKEVIGLSEFKASETLISSLRLNIEMDSAFTRQLVLAFRENSSVEEDHAMDARAMDNNASDISWNIKDEEYIINVRPKVDEELIPLYIFLEKDTSLKFSIQEMNNFNPDRVFIYDAQEDLYFGIKTGYLKIALSKGEYEDRFFVSFIEKLSVPNPINNENISDVSSPKPTNVLLNTIDVFQNNAQEQLEVKVLYDTSIESVRLYDLGGKLIFNEKFKGKEKEYYLPTGKLSTAVYIVKINTTDQKELTKKVGIKN